MPFIKSLIAKITDHENRWITLLVTVMGCLVLYISFHQSVWLDEGLSIEFSRRTVSELLKVSMRGDLHPPLYNLFLHFSGLIISKNIWWYRFWSGVSYIAAAIILLRSIQEKITSTKHQLIAMSLFLLSPFAVYYASEARMYMSIILVTLIQFIAFDKLCAGKGDVKKNTLVYTISSVIGTYLFYPILFSLIGQFIYIVIFARDQFKKLFWPWVIITVAYLPWIFLVLIHRLNENPGHFLQIPWWQIPAIIFVGFSGGRVAVTDLHHVHDYWPSILVSLVNALNFIGLWRLVKEKKNHSELIRLATLIIVPIIICLLVSMFRFSIFDPRYYTEVFPLFIILLIWSVEALYKVKPRFAQITSIALIAVNLLFLGLYLFNPWYEREPWKKVVPVVEAQMGSTDAMVFIGFDQPPPTYALYQTKPLLIVSTYPKYLTDIEDYAMIEKHLTDQLQGATRVWYSSFLEWQKDPEHKIRKILEKDFVYVKTVGFFKVEFDLYDRKK